jgi:hypothetical protein
VKRFYATTKKASPDRRHRPALWRRGR